ncbi:MAG: TatD family hydrolase, partial [Lachnospiraceae bacterium]|nr:TatD family hydrolase [Lachnospiraceae bacterium]
ESIPKVLRLAADHEDVNAAVGGHPDNVGELDEESFAKLRTAAQQGIYEGGSQEGSEDAGAAEQEACGGGPSTVVCDRAKVVAIGEIGLDHHWMVAPREVQKQWFVRQAELAMELGLPVIIHSRDAAEDTMETVRSLAKTGDFRAVMHCYSYSPEQAREYLDMGLYLGIGGVVTFKNARKLVETVKLAPLERLLTETDCPYLAPEPFRGKRNSSLYLPYVVEKIAQIKGIDREEVERVLYENALRFFFPEKDR